MSLCKYNPQSREDLLMLSLSKFYKKKDNIETLLKLLNINSDVSLRSIDWTVTNFAKKNNIMYNINAKTFIMYLDYKSQLKAYSKKLFDPFCRRDRILFYYNEIDRTKNITTTIGQLNFFRWAIQNNILAYIQDNIQSIEKDMNNSIKKKVHLVSNDDNKKRHELSISATRTVTKHDVKIRIQFN
jgi:hypothetical protein